MDSEEIDIHLLPQRALVRSNGPLYRQLAGILREPIANGALPVGAELPKEALIADRFGVSLITVRQALRDLERDGLIRKRSAKPAVITARTPPVTLSWSFSNFADMAAFTKDARLDIRSYRRETSPILQKHFGLAKSESGYCLRGVLAVGDQKKAQVTSYFPPHIGKVLKRRDFTDALIFRSLQRRLSLRLEVAHVTICAEVADRVVADDLDVDPGSAILTVQMLYQTSDQRNVEFTVARHPAHLFRITYDAPNDLG